jgi:hypothetical protein
MSTTETEQQTSNQSSQGARRLPPRTVVGALWLFAILNYLYCDVLSLHDRTYLNDILAPPAGGIVFNDLGLVAAGVLMTIPMSAVLISRIGSHALARWFSVAAGVVMTVVQIGTLFIGSASPLYLYFSAIEIVTTAFIAWYAIARWRNEG